MAKALEVIREYSKADDKMLEQAQTMRNLFETDKADFTAMYTGLADPYSADWQSDIDAAQALPLVSEELAQLEVLTEDVETALENARVQYVKMSSYVKLLFPDSPARQNLFGLDLYDKVRLSQTKMYDLMQQGYKKANDAAYSGDLIALGFLQTEIDALNTLAGALYDANEAQEEYKKLIKVRTEDRIKAYNKVWASMVEVSNASKQVYVSDYAKQQQYLLYPEGGGGTLPGKVVGMAYDLTTGQCTWTAVDGATEYELQFAPDLPSPIFTQVYLGSELGFVYDPGGPDNYLFRCRAKNLEGYGEWSDVLTVVRP